MKLKLGLIGLASGMVVACAVAAGLDDVVAPGTVAEKLADGFKFTEGATVNAAGEVFFVDQPNNKILRWSREQGLRTFMEPAGRANGMYFRAGRQPAESAPMNGVVVGHAGWQGDGAYEGARRQGAEWPQRCVGLSGGRRLLFHGCAHKRPWWTHTDAP